MSALKLWFKKNLKEGIDKPRVFHQLLPMQIEYENGIAKVKKKYNIIKYVYNKNHYIMLCFLGCITKTKRYWSSSDSTERRRLSS